MILSKCLVCPPKIEPGEPEGKPGLTAVQEYQLWVEHLSSIEHLRKSFFKYSNCIRSEMPLEKDRFVISGLPKEVPNKLMMKLAVWLTEFGFLADLLYIPNEGFCVAAVQAVSIGGRGPSVDRLAGLLKQTEFLGSAIKVYKKREITTEQWNNIYGIPQLGKLPEKVKGMGRPMQGVSNPPKGPEDSRSNDSTEGRRPRDTKSNGSTEDRSQEPSSNGSFKGPKSNSKGRLHQTAAATCSKKASSDGGNEKAEGVPDSGEHQNGQCPKSGVKSLQSTIKSWDQKSGDRVLKEISVESSLKTECAPEAKVDIDEGNADDNRELVTESKKEELHVNPVIQESKARAAFRTGRVSLSEAKRIRADFNRRHGDMKDGKKGRRGVPPLIEERIVDGPNLPDENSLINKSAEIKSSGREDWPDYMKYALYWYRFVSQDTFGPQTGISDV